MYKHILIPTDGSDLATEATGKALAFAQSVGAEVTILTVVEPFHVITSEPAQLATTRDAWERHAKESTDGLLARTVKQAEALGVRCHTAVVEAEHPYEAIIAGAVGRGCDLIAMASHGRRGIAAILIGSQTLKVLTHSRIPVLVYR